MNTTSDAIVVGAGVIGTAIAWRCAQRGIAVTLVDPDPTRGAWHTAAGMLAPITELHYTETPLLRLNLDSLARYPAFVEELSELTGMPTGFRECGTVSAAWDGADLGALQDLHGFLTQLGMRAELLDGRQLRALEPTLASGLPGGLLAADDHQVDPRLLHAALLDAARRCGVRVLTTSAAIICDGAAASGVTLADGTRVTAPVTVLAAGGWSATVDGLPVQHRPPVRPVKGQTLRLRVPGGSGMRHVVVGASSEEAGFDQSPRAGAVYDLLRDAQSLLPQLSEAVLEEVSTGFRPGSPDNAPLIGPSELTGLVYATGHYRNGVLLTPVTADAVADLVTTATMPTVVEAFTPARFRPAVPA